MAPDDDLGDAFPDARVGLAVELAQDLLGLVGLDGSGGLVHDDVRALFGRDTRLDFLADEVGILDGLEGLLWSGPVRRGGAKVDDGLAHVDVLLRGGRDAGLLSPDPVVDSAFPSPDHTVLPQKTHRSHDGRQVRPSRHGFDLDQNELDGLDDHHLKTTFVGTVMFFFREVLGGTGMIQDARDGRTLLEADFGVLGMILDEVGRIVKMSAVMA